MFLVVIALMDVAEQHYDKMVNYILTLKLKQTFLMNNFKRHLHQQLMTQYQTKGVLVFSYKNILIPNVAEKKYSDFGGGKKNNLIQSYCHIT